MNIEAKIGPSGHDGLTTFVSELLKLKRDLFFISHLTHDKLDPDKDRSREEHTWVSFDSDEIHALWSLMQETEDRAKALFSTLEGWMDEEDAA